MSQEIDISPPDEAAEVPTDEVAAASAPVDSSMDGDEEVWEEEVGTRSWTRALRTVPAWLVSLIFHLGILLALGLFTVVNEEELQGVFVSASVADDQVEELDEFVEVELDSLQELEEMEHTDLTSDIADVGVIAFGDLSMPTEIEAGGDIGDLDLPETTIDEIGSLLGKDGEGMADISDGLKAAASFFGAKSRGDEFVFVVDNSNSMTRGRFETALMELMYTIEAMTPQQKFCVIFFSDTAYRMFHPEPASGMIAATEQNKQRLRSWLGTVQMCLQTRGQEAVTQALAMRPDVIYILGDGAFTDKTTQILTAPHNRPIPIHTLGMEVDPAGARQLQAIAKANGGTYRLVGATPQAKLMAKRNPIPRNSIRGPVWGIKLSPVARKKKNKR